MGLNTTIMILNDHLGSIENDTQFGRKLVDAIHRAHASAGGPVELCGVGKVIETHHADSLTAVVVGGNTGHNLGFAGNHAAVRCERDDVFTILSTLAAQYDLEVKRPKGREWTLDVRIHEAWETLAEKTSADACKSAARALRDNYLTGEPAFRIYDPLGRLYAVSADNHSWRMKWKPGNMLTREQMSEREAKTA